MANEISRRRTGLMPWAAKSFAWKWRPVPNKVRNAPPAASAIHSIFLRAASRNVTPAMIQMPITSLHRGRRFRGNEPREGALLDRCHQRIVSPLPSRGDSSRGFGQETDAGPTEFTLGMGRGGDHLSSNVRRGRRHVCCVIADLARSGIRQTLPLDSTCGWTKLTTASNTCDSSVCFVELHRASLALRCQEVCSGE